MGAALAFAAYLLNQRFGSGDAWMYETESVITMLMGLWMVNVVFALGHRLLNFKSSRVTYFVNASLFIYGPPSADAVFRGVHYAAYQIECAGLLHRSGLCGWHCHRVV